MRQWAVVVAALLGYLGVQAGATIALREAGLRWAAFLVTVVMVAGAYWFGYYVARAVFTSSDGETSPS